MENELDVKKLSESKIYVREGVSFMQPKALVEPFLENIHWDGEPIRVKSQNDVVNENEEDHTRNTAYPRFLIEVDRGPDERLPGYTSVMGMLVSMDQAHPVVKIYSGQNVMACLNLSIFNSADIYAQDLLKNLDRVWSTAGLFYDNESNQIETYATVQHKLVNTWCNQQEVNKALGIMLRKANKLGLGTSAVVGAAKSFEDPKSVYYQSGDMRLDNLYNAVTQSITDSKDLLYKPEKTIAVAEILNLMAA